jgi:hypothetical protein
MNFHKDKDVEGVLRANRPEPRDELVRDLAARAHAGPAPRSHARLALAGALSVVMLVALAAVGGLGYAATAAKDVVHAVVAPARQHVVITVAGLTAGGDQYRPGFGFGDPNHNHSGPPGVKKQGGAFAPPLTAVKQGIVEKVSTVITIDEQAHLFISVVGPDGVEFQLSQKHSKIGGGISGVPAKNINYLKLIPGSLPLAISVIKGQLTPGVIYRIRVIARDPQGNKTTAFIPFRV